MPSLDFSVKAPYLSRSNTQNGVERSDALQCMLRFECMVQGKKMKVHPEDVAVQYERLAGLSKELSELASRLGGQAGEALLDESAAKASATILMPKADVCVASLSFSSC